MRRSEFVNLIGDTDEAIRTARFAKDLFVLDPTARRAVLQAREAVIQSWIEERTPDQLSEQERVIVRNPERYDRPIISAVNVAFGASPVTITLEFDVPPHLWPRISASWIPVAHRVAREGVLFGRKALRFSLKLQGAEIYRANVDAEGNIVVVFQYE